MLNFAHEIGLLLAFRKDKYMKLIKEYLCDDRTPSDEEIRECLEIVEREDCTVKLKWFFPYNGWHRMYIEKGMTFEDCKGKLPRVYGV